MKHWLAAQAERALNVVTNPFGLRILLLPQSALHNEPISFRADGVITSHTANFLEDAHFLEVVDSVRRESTHSLYNLYRIYLQVQTAALARRIPGAIFVECGVGEGCASLIINRYFSDRGPETYLIDTYSGIDIRFLGEHELLGMTPEERRAEALRSYPLSDFASIEKRFAPYPNVHLVQGAVPDVLTQQRGLFDGKTISWLHIDMNNALPEYSALKFFYSQVVAGGLILFDDYGFKALRPQKDAVDQACRELGIPIPISLPTGQGLIIKTAH